MEIVLTSLQMRDRLSGRRARGGGREAPGAFFSFPPKWLPHFPELRADQTPGGAGN